MVLEKLGDSLKETLAKITGSTIIDEALVNQIVKDIQRALLQSDVNVKLVFSLTQKIKERALKEKPLPGISPKEYIITIVYDELVVFLGQEEKNIDFRKRKPFKLMLVGLFGNGKTTTAGKLAHYYLKRGVKLAMISLDVWRPAAFEQLRQLGQQLGVTVYGDPKEKDPAKVYKKFEKEFSQYEMIIVDTAGRDALSDELIDELKIINETVNADETLLVIGADVGQAAELQAKTFHEHCGVNGVIISKLDGTAKGGGALSACAVTGAPVKFIGLGEKINDLESFDPKGFVGRLLGMGDLKALLAKADEAMKGADQEAMAKRIMKGEFTLIDLYDQMKALRSMGPLNKVMELIPGFSSVKMPKELLAVQEEKLGTWKYILDSCTKEELEDPETIDYHRIERIAKGSGCDQKDLRELLKQYRNGKKMMKMFQGGNPKNMDKMMKRMGGMKGMMNSMGGDMGKLQDAFKKMK